MIDSENVTRVRRTEEVSKSTLNRLRSSSLHHDTLALSRRRWFECSHDSLRAYSISSELRGQDPRKEPKKHTSSKTSFKPVWVFAEHSTYLNAPSSHASSSPSSLVIGFRLCLCSFSFTSGSSRKSIWVPTMRQGTPGQWRESSGNHFSFTFSKEVGEVTSKQIRKTSVRGYDRGRRRSNPSWPVQGPRWDTLRRCERC